jgi:DNA polymerase-1
MKKFMLFDADYVGYNVDLSQAENRIVAYVGPVPEMMKAFELGMDVHSLTAALIFSEPIDKIKEEDKLGLPCSLGDGTHTKRFWGKKANHGLNYDLGYRSFSLYYEIPESDAKFIVDRYHMAYPGVRQGYHTQVRDMLSRHRTVSNCMGRKRLFLDRWGDQLFKDAYAQIPQSTVADVINERGIEHIYYDQVNYGYVELLLQVHDSIVFQIPLSVPWKEHARILMRIKASLETPLEWKTRTFTIPADVQMSLGHMGKGSGGLTDVKREHFTNQDMLARELERLSRLFHG